MKIRFVAIVIDMARRRCPEFCNDECAHTLYSVHAIQAGYFALPQPGALAFLEAKCTVINFVPSCGKVKKQDFCIGKY